MTEDARGAPLEIGDTVIYNRSGSDCSDRFMAVATVVNFEKTDRVTIEIQDLFLTPLGFKPIHFGSLSVPNDESGRIALRGSTANTRNTTLVKVDALPNSTRSNTVNIPS